MVSLVRDEVISPLELVDAHLDQIAHRNPQLNAFVTCFTTKRAQEARKLSRGDWRGMLHGVPITVKDSFDIAGQPTRSGSLSRPVPPAAAGRASRSALARRRRHHPRAHQHQRTAARLRMRQPDHRPHQQSLGLSSARPEDRAAARRRPLRPAVPPVESRSDGGGSIRIPAHFLRYRRAQAHAGPHPVASVTFRRSGIRPAWSPRWGRWRAPSRTCACCSACSRATTPTIPSRFRRRCANRG